MLRFAWLAMTGLLWIAPTIAQTAFTPRTTRAAPSSRVAFALAGRRCSRARCAYRKSNPAILMVQSAQDRAADDIPGPLNAAMDRGILVQ
jgi:hypothetical protein